jgi:acyl-CoA hydrolase/GNAT superfamily N-acetyltransferase
MEWQTLYKQRLKSPDRAVAPIRSGQYVFVGSGSAEPQTLVEALTARSDRLADTIILHILTLGLAPYTEARFQNTFRHNAFFIGPNVRDAVNECRADYTPIFLSEVPNLFRRGQIPVDYALIQVSPPDEHGYCSLGVSVDVVKTATETARHIIAEVNKQMPRTLGDSFLHVGQISAFVESDRPLLELPPPEQDEVMQRIGRYIADLVEDGSTLQMGIGGIPDAVLANLKDKRDLGVHTEMLCDGIIPLVETGVINGRRKTLHPGKIITTFCMGTRAIYDFVDNNPVVEFRPTEYVNDPFRIAQNDKMVAINAAIEVDLTGQVCADSIGEYFYSGIGGQVDFIRGAARSRGGKPIIAMPSTATLPDGARVSRIVPDLKQGAGVVTSRGDVHYIVTEYGIAYLHGKSIRERAMALMSIAHPDFRADLLAAAKKRRLVMPDQTDRALVPRYPEEFEEWADLAYGARVFLRPIRPTDEDMLREFHYQLSDETVFRRYRHPLRSLPHHERMKLVNVDYEREMALVAVQRTESREELLGVGRYYVDDATRMAEVAFTVRDDWQDMGIGTLLMRKLIHVARAKHLAGFEAYTQPDNDRMVNILMHHGFTVAAQEDADTLHWRLVFAEHKGTPGAAEAAAETDEE